MKKFIYGTLSLIVLFVAIALSIYFIKTKEVPEKDAKKHSITYVQAEKVNLSEIETSMSYRGRLTAFDQVSLSAEVSGKILQGDVRFKAGESFRKGDVIIRIYNEDVKALLKSNKSSLLQTISKILPDLRIDYNSEYDKWLAFFNKIDAEKPLPALPKINSNQEKVFLAANNVLTSYYNLQQQEINLSRYTIYAPFNGSFKTVNKEIGAIASPSSELASIIRTDKLEVIVPIWPSDLAYISKDDKVTLINNSGVEKEATVSRIANFVEAASQSVNAYLTYNASGHAGFLEGEYVDVYIKGETITGFKIPREALFDNNHVYILKNGKLEVTTVEVLRQLEDTFIIAGLDKDAMIVTESIASVNPDMEYQAR